MQLVTDFLCKQNKKCSSSNFALITIVEKNKVSYYMYQTSVDIIIMN